MIKIIKSEVKSRNKKSTYHKVFSESAIGVRSDTWRDEEWVWEMHGERGVASAVGSTLKEQDIV